jgi:hypothetical protein
MRRPWSKDPHRREHKLYKNPGLSFLLILTLGQPGLSRGFVDFFLIFRWNGQTDGQTDIPTDRQT